MRGVSRSIAKQWIVSGKVRLQGKIAKPSAEVAADDDVSIEENAANSLTLDAHLPMPVSGTSFSVLYEDEDVLVINKPAGLTVHPGNGVRGYTLVDALRSYTHLADQAGDNRPGIVHRLDKDTQGVMVIAKTNLAYDGLKRQFQNREIIKKYLARVTGVVAKDDIQISTPIGRHRTQRLHMTTAPNSRLVAKPALTVLKVLYRWTNQTLIEAQPITGRTHQIRVHLAAIGHPIIGDRLYNKRVGKRVGLCLQAVSIRFRHPTSNQEMECSVPVIPEILGEYSYESLKE